MSGDRATFVLCPSNPFHSRGCDGQVKGGWTPGDLECRMGYIRLGGGHGWNMEIVIKDSIRERISLAL